MSRGFWILGTIALCVLAGSLTADDRIRTVEVVKTDDSGTIAKSVKIVERDGYCSNGSCRSVTRTKASKSGGSAGNVTVKMVARSRVK